MKVTILDRKSEGRINPSIIKKMSIPADHQSLVLFSCYCLINGEKQRCIKGAAAASEVEMNKGGGSEVVRYNKKSLHEKLVLQMHSKSTDYMPLVETIFDYMNCENALYDEIQKSPNKSLGCSLFINAVDETSNLLVISDPDSWDKATEAIQLDYNFDIRRLI